MSLSMSVQCMLSVVYPHCPVHVYPNRLKIFLRCLKVHLEEVLVPGVALAPADAVGGEVEGPTGQGHPPALRGPVL